MLRYDLGRQIEYWYRPVWLGFRWGVFTWVGCQITHVIPPIWRVTLRSCEMEFH